jgi:hypothetical protein
MAMDDPDIFRKAWEQMQAQENLVHSPVSADKIIRKRSRNAVSRFRLSLLIELWIGVAILAGLLLFYFLYPSLQYGYYLVAISSMMLVCGVFFSFQYKNLKKSEPLYYINVKESITQILSWMNRFVLTYLRLHQLIFAFCITIFLIISVNFVAHSYPGISDAPDALVLLAMILLSVIATLLVYPFQRLYIRWMFGKYMDNLRDNLQELEENDAA